MAFAMLYVLALLLPTVAIMAAGRWLTGIILTPVWIISAGLTVGGSQIVFIIIAWILIAQARSDRRHRELLAAISQQSHQPEPPS